MVGAERKEPPLSCVSILSLHCSFCMVFLGFSSLLLADTADSSSLVLFPIRTTAETVATSAVMHVSVEGQETGHRNHPDDLRPKILYLRAQRCPEAKLVISPWLLRTKPSGSSQHTSNCIRTRCQLSAPNGRSRQQQQQDDGTISDPQAILVLHSTCHPGCGLQSPPVCCTSMPSGPLWVTGQDAAGSLHLQDPARVACSVDRLIAMPACRPVHTNTLNAVLQQWLGDRQLHLCNCRRIVLQVQHTTPAIRNPWAHAAFPVWLAWRFEGSKAGPDHRASLRREAVHA